MDLRVGSQERGQRIQLSEENSNWLVGQVFAIKGTWMSTSVMGSISKGVVTAEAL